MERTGSKLTDFNDAQLVRKALDEDSQAAYFAIYARYHIGVCAQISKIIRNRNEIEDICMETFEKAFKQLASYRTDARFSTWILTIARNTALDYKDKENARVKRIETSSMDSGESDASRVADPSISPEDEIIKTQLHESFIDSIDGLPALYKEIARMCFVDNLGYKEIAEKTGIPLNTVKTRIRRAKDMLSETMQGAEE